MTNIRYVHANMLIVYFNMLSFYFSLAVLSVPITKGRVLAANFATALYIFSKYKMSKIPPLGRPRSRAPPLPLVHIMWLIPLPFHTVTLTITPIILTLIGHHLHPQLPFSVKIFRKRKYSRFSRYGVCLHQFNGRWLGDHLPLSCKQASNYLGLQVRNRRPGLTGKPLVLRKLSKTL